MTNTCVCGCGRALHDGYAAVECTEQARRQLLGDERDPDRPGIIDLAPAARDIAHRQARRGTGGGHGKPGSALPLDLGATARLDAVTNTLTTWARHVAEERTGSMWVAMPGEPAAQAAAWLAAHCEWMRHRAEVDAFLRDVKACHRVLAGLADPNTDNRVIVGRCTCDRVLYALPERDTITCPDCELVWDVDECHDSLRQDVHEQLVTAAEAAHLGAYLDTDRTSEQVRKLVNKWAERDQLEPRDGREVLIKHHHRDRCEPNCAQVTDRLAVYRFGDIADRLANTPRRAAQAAGMGA